jgi:hypothetical protein
MVVPNDLTPRAAPPVKIKSDVDIGDQDQGTPDIDPGRSREQSPASIIEWMRPSPAVETTAHVADSQRSFPDDPLFKQALAQIAKGDGLLFLRTSIASKRVECPCLA